MVFSLPERCRRVVSGGWILVIAVALPLYSQTAGAVEPVSIPPEPDSVYSQDVGFIVESKVPLTAVATRGGRVFVGTTNGVSEFRGDRLERS